MDMLLNILDFQHPVWRIAVLAVLPLLALLIALPPLRKIFRHWQLQGLIKRLGQGHLKQSRIYNGEDEVYVEHLVLQPDGMTLLMVRPYRGNIFAAEKIDMWTQVLGNHSYKFPNPLYELERDTQLLRAILREVPVRGMVVFGQGSRFPKGKPQQVYDFGMLRDEAKKTVHGVIPERFVAAWTALQGFATPSRHLQHAILYQKGDKRRLLLGVVLVAFAIAFAAWQLGWIKAGG